MCIGPAVLLVIALVIAGYLFFNIEDDENG